MYIKITKTYLRELENKDICAIFQYPSTNLKLTKENLIARATKKPSTISKKDRANYGIYVLICEFCRKSGVLYTAAGKIKNTKPHACVFCGRIAPWMAFEYNLAKCTELLKLASQKGPAREKVARETLIEQALVSFITNLEIYLRTTYALNIDLDHVVYGKSIYEMIYKETRNQFLNMGAINKQLKNAFSIDLKRELGNETFIFLSKMYSARHIIVHNGGIKDKEYISQTGEDFTELKKSILIRIGEVRTLISDAKKIVKKVDTKLNRVLVQYSKNAYEFKTENGKLLTMG